MDSQHLRQVRLYRWVLGKDVHISGPVAEDRCVNSPGIQLSEGRIEFSFLLLQTGVDPHGLDCLAGRLGLEFRFNAPEEEGRVVYGCRSAVVRRALASLQTDE